MQLLQGGIVNVRLADLLPRIRLNMGVGMEVTEVTITGEDMEFKLVTQPIQGVGDGSDWSSRFITGQIVIYNNQYLNHYTHEFFLDAPQSYKAPHHKQSVVCYFRELYYSQRYKLKTDRPS